MTIEVTLASAGTGKTAYLVDRLVEAVAAGVAPERIVATTFTVAAASELVERCRVRLMAEGDFAGASRLLQARIGTTHAVCGRIAEDFGFELGLSPSLRVASEEAAAAMFATATDEVLARHAERLDPLAAAFGARPLAWREDVRRIVALARANAIDDLADSADWSTRGVLDLLPAPEADPVALDDSLAFAIGRTLDAVEGVVLGTEARDLVAAILSARASLQSSGAVPWPLWAELARAKTSSADADHFRELATAAAGHPRHPRLRADIADFIRLVFACAAEAIVAYQAFKTATGQVDFIDQERFGLEALAREDVRACLAGDIDLLLVDELQDSSPLELEIFGVLAGIAGSTVWVGDLKQSIYSFRGGDASLVGRAVDDALAASGFPLQVLSASRRARPGICAFVNAAFGPAFDAAGLGASARFTGLDDEPDVIARDPLSVWFVAGRNRLQRADALASAIVGVLAQSAEWPVRADGGVRPVEAGDIAVLCRLNDEVEVLAAALARAGAEVAVERDELSRRPEAEFLTAAMRWIADRGDRLALVELVRLAGGDEAQERWLEALSAEDPDAALLALLPFGADLLAIRSRRRFAAPLELLDAVIVGIGIADIAARWGEGGARLEVVDALRGRAAAYVDTCRRGAKPATLAGLVAALADQGAARSRARGGEGVTVTTYHRAKGCEWPLTIVTSLDVDLPARFAGPVVEEGEAGTGGPLAGRWIRFWPRPYAGKTAGVPLHAAMRDSPAGCLAAARDRAEALRLLYVGFTRARDHLVFTCSSAGTAWLRRLDVDETPRLVLPMYEGRPILIEGRPHPAEFRVVKAAKAGSDLARSVHVPLVDATRVHRPLRLRPSEATGSHRVVAHALGDRLTVAGRPDMTRVGEACHAFFAIDERIADGRLERAADILDRWGVARHLAPHDLVEAAERLWVFADRRFPGWRWRREVPVSARLDGRLISGRIDLLGEGGVDFVLVDHKAFPGSTEAANRRAAFAAGQLDAYARAATAATGRGCAGLFVHLPLVGIMHEVIASA